MRPQRRRLPSNAVHFTQDEPEDLTCGLAAGAHQRRANKFGRVERAITELGTASCQ